MFTLLCVNPVFFIVVFMMLLVSPISWSCGSILEQRLLCRVFFCGCMYSGDFGASPDMVDFGGGMERVSAAMKQENAAKPKIVEMIRTH